MRVLLPVDESDGGRRAAEWVIAHRRGAELHIVNVQLPVASGGVKMFISKDSLNDYYRDEALAALKSVRDLLDSNKVQYHYHIGVGAEAETIVRFAGEQNCDEIVIAKSDPGLFKFGSVSRKVAQLSPVPVVLIP